MAFYVTLYGRARCSLCDKLREALRPLLDELSLRIYEVDIQSQSDLIERFGWIVPVLMPGLPDHAVSIQPLCQTRLDNAAEVAIRTWVQYQHSI